MSKMQINFVSQASVALSCYLNKWTRLAGLSLEKTTWCQEWDGRYKTKSKRNRVLASL